MDVNHLMSVFPQVVMSVRYGTRHPSPLCLKVGFKDELSTNHGSPLPLVTKVPSSCSGCDSANPRCSNSADNRDRGFWFQHCLMTSQIGSDSQRSAGELIGRSGRSPDTM